MMKNRNIYDKMMSFPKFKKVLLSNVLLDFVMFIR